MQCNRSFVDPSPAIRSIPVHTSSATPRSFTLMLLLLLTACLLCSPVATAEETLTTTPKVMITPTVGPPTTKVLAAGSGFDPYVAVDIYFDKTDVALATTDTKGAFGRIAVVVPASAVPGTHWVTAVERSSRKSAQQAFLVRTDWAEFGFVPNHGNWNWYENVLSPATVGGLGVLWQIAGSYSSNLAVANGVVYVGAAGNSLLALNASTGALIWQYTAGGGVNSVPAVANGVVYFGSDDFNVYALDASTGALLWKYATMYPIDYSSPAVANGVVYIGSNDGNLYALNARTGALLWTYSNGWPIVSSPAVANGVVYIGSYSVLNALNASTGALLWSYGTGDVVNSSPAVANGVVYFGSFDHNLYAVNARTGALRWTYTTWGPIDHSSPAVANGMVYVSDNSWELYAVHADTGYGQWTRWPSLPGSAAVANGVLYFGSWATGNTLYAFDATWGRQLWTYPGNFGSPVVVNAVVYAVSDEGLYAFGLPTGLSKSFSPPQLPDPTLLVPNLTLKPSTPVTRMTSD